MNKKTLKVFLLASMLLTLTGCTQTTGSDGKTLPEKIIYSTTTFKEMLENESWFTSIFTYPIAQAINFLDKYVGVVFAVILVTLLVNAILLPLTIKSTAGTQKMQMLQPEMDKIQRKYEGKDDERSKMLQAQELQALYKKYDVNPVTTLAGTFITIPIVIAMYQAVIRCEAVVNGKFLGADLQVSPLDSIKVGGRQAVVCLVIFVVMGITQYLSSNIAKWLADSKNKQDHKTRSYTPESENAAQNKTMVWSMLIMILFMGATFPTAMSVYWMVSSSINVLKTYLIQKLVVEKGIK